MGNTDAETIVQKILQEFPDASSRPSSEEVERVMRPFGALSYETWREIDQLLHEQGGMYTSSAIDPWMEANFVVSGEGPMVEQRIQFLLTDTCTCVLEHLPAAIANATRPVDPRISKLLEHTEH
ncbi:MAG: hypothetical protein WCX61_01390 [Candidatus Peribacteraceae bacterium]|jgi:hypothetical protein